MPAALLVSWPLLRGWGQIVVRIKLPERTKGFMSIYITEKPDQVRREKVDKKTGREKLVSARRFDFLKRFGRHMAGRETTFRWIPVRKAMRELSVSGARAGPAAGIYYGVLLVLLATVITGLFDALRAIDPASRLHGFLDYVTTGGSVPQGAVWRLLRSWKKRVEIIF